MINARYDGTLAILCAICFGIALCGCAGKQSAKPPLRIGSKKFTESVLLGEIAVATLRVEGIPARRDDLGGTPACWLALTQGDIDLYPEYTGTIRKQILQTDTDNLAEAMLPFGIGVSSSLGFSNNYALGMKKNIASEKGIRKISDLVLHPALKCGFIHEFLDRPDGWPGLKQHYRLPQTNVVGMNHTLAYRALVEESIDVMELYTTDGEIIQYDLAVLEDDLGFFPKYEAVWLYRLDLTERAPEAIAALKRWEGKITTDAMQTMNSTVQVEKTNESKLAAEFTRSTLGVGQAVMERPSGLVSRLWETTIEHLSLVIPSLLAAIIVSLPLGVVAARRPGLGKAIVLLSGILQTIPSLALLLFMIPVMKWLTGSGTGAGPAIAALFLYSLLPIVRNTLAGLQSISPALKESAWAMGLPPFEILRRVELPLALPTIIAGIKTAAVINVGSATLGGFIGAGGYGKPILRGLDKFDIPLMLEGAIPAALMALCVEYLFTLLASLLDTRGSRRT